MTARPNYTILEADLQADRAIIVQLFREYARAINVDLGFQNFEAELEHLESHYGAPHGMVLLVQSENQNVVGCAAIRPLGDGICELKRMYLKPEARGHGLGGAILDRAISSGQDLGYKYMRLDTMSMMQAAIKLYRKAGFYEIEAYRFNPVPGTKYFELALTG